MFPFHLDHTAVMCCNFVLLYTIMERIILYQEHFMDDAYE